MTETTKKAIPAEQPALSLWASAWRHFRARRLAMIGLWVVGVYLVMALCGESIYWRYRTSDRAAPYKQPDLTRQYQPPGMVNGSFYLMGTDGLGRSVFLRLVQGARIAFKVGLVTSLIAIPIGVILGCLAGYFGGIVDDLIVWLYSTFQAIPGLLLILAIAMVAGKGLLGVYLGIGLTTWVGLCRLVRAEVLKHRGQAYVQAARVMGYHPFRIMFLHILPNVMHVVIVTFTLRFSMAINTEVFMSFLGLGVANEPSWGLMINSARLRLWQGIWWEMTFVTLAIFFLVMALNIVGDTLRDALDPRCHLEVG